MEGQKFELAITQSEEAIITWEEIIIPSPMEYVNHILYYIGHLDDDHIVSGYTALEVDDDTNSTASGLARKLDQTLSGVRNVASDSNKAGDIGDNGNGGYTTHTTTR